ncbi:hypothetical protein BLOT_015863 [Blomia tropicalis]|nr:hypothetical protein BLOT_015863 [Blomia tropicalis]
MVIENIISYFGLFIAIIITLHLYFKRKYSYWSERGLKTPPPVWFFGNVLQRISPDRINDELKWVKQYGKIYGTYSMIQPSLVVAEPDLVQKILVTDFSHFVNRMQPKSYHELWNNNLFSTEDDSWKRARAIASPSFSSGRLRRMHDIMQHNVNKLDTFFARKSEENGSGTFPVQIKHVVAGFTIDVIASTAFATETNANFDQNNLFVSNGKKLFELNPIRAICCFLLPTRILNLLGIKIFFNPKIFDFFINLTSCIVKDRKNNQNERKRHDLVQLLIDANINENELIQMNYDKMTASETEQTSESYSTDLSSKKYGLTNLEIISNSILFFVAGFETTASAITHLIFELAQNPEIQQRLADELCAKLNQLNENSDEYFDQVMNHIPYLEACIKETLRRYPPVSVMARICGTNNYRLNDRITLNKGQLVMIPTSAIHLNSEFYPNPHRFNPERFMPENRQHLHPHAFLPFSLGPRNCIAMRFAYQEIKLCLSKIVRRYCFKPSLNTPKELKFMKGSAVLIADQFEVLMEKRS